MKVENGTSKQAANVCIAVDTTDLDKAIEKANRLIELLREAQQIIDSLHGQKTQVEIKLNLSDAYSDDAIDKYINGIKTDLIAALK